MPRVSYRKEEIQACQRLYKLWASADTKKDPCLRDLFHRIYYSGFKRVVTGHFDKPKYLYTRFFAVSENS